MRSRIIMLAVLAGIALGASALGAADGEYATLAQEILDATGTTGGLVVHLGCGDGKLTAALHAGDGYLVHGLDADAESVGRARAHISSLRLYGEVSVDTFAGRRLPYADDLVSLLVTERLGQVPMSEVTRVLRPHGVAYVRRAGQWTKTVKPRPAEIDEWSHYLHDAGNNAVAHDTRVGPPRSLQWIGSPRWTRHHDRMSSISALVSAGGRLFYILDEGSTASILLPSRWTLIARDAFSGVVLWKKPIPEWHTRLWPLKSGPAQLPRRLVATADAVYVTLGLDVPLTALDAATGETLRTYDGTRGVEEILFSDGVLFLLVDPSPDLDKYRRQSAVRDPWWTGKTVRVMAIEAASGAALWQYEASVAPLTLAADGKRVLFHDGVRVVCLDRAQGDKLWESDPVPVVQRVMSFFAPTLVVRDGVVLFAGGEESGLVKSTGGATKSDTLTAMDADTGAVLWTAEHPPSGYSSPEDVFVIDGTVWCGGVSNGSFPGAFTGLALRTGEVKGSHAAADVETYWFHHRCHRGKATDRYLMMSRTGIEFIDPLTGHWDINHWVRGGCLYGIMPANGLLYAPPHPCACYPESKLFGFSALGPASAVVQLPEAGVDDGRLERGPAYGEPGERSTSAVPNPNDWPTYRHDSERSGATTETVAAELAETWQADIGGRLSAVTVAEGKVFVAAVDAHTVYAVDAASGNRVWSYTAGGRVDSPPTIHNGAAIFGCADGWIYSVRAGDGELIWRFRAAPAESRITAFEQLESRWPVHGSVLIQGGVAHAVAGRSLFLDGGMRLCRLDAATGRLLSETVLDERDPETGENIQVHVKRLTMPVALPDVLSGDGRHVYMRSQVFDMQGKRQDIAPHAAALGAHAAVQEGETRHLFSSNGFLDGTWFHRSYWVYGRSFEGGWNSYYLAGRRVPAGKILAFDNDNVYGFGREQRYFRWTTPMEFHLFASPRERRTEQTEEDEGSIIRVSKSKSLDPTGSPITVMAWVRSEGRDGVVVARGGGVQGYSLYIRSGTPHFAVCSNSKRGDVSASRRVGGDWTHLAGVLTAEPQLRIYVNGELAGTASAPGLVARDPADEMQIGGDEGSVVGGHEGGLPLKGIIDEVRVYHGELPEESIRRLAQATGDDPESLVLHFSFDKGNAADASGNKNRGTVVGATPAEGRVGGAMRFSGRLPGEQPVAVAYEWSGKVPILVRGMLVAGKTLFIAGPDDLLDEPSALGRMDEPDVQEKLTGQDAALAGQSGGILRAVAAADGSTLFEQRLDTIPVWDGLAAASGRLYLAGSDGTLRCYSGT
ncbi:MAG: PQQ-binding-like beta-propeller repeat protein [Armatimonadota bacterium]|jgi:outer membrane protein assembly factor BamB